ncbi:MAG: segregation/condensation protein A [Treponema sp.]|nr:segregation/condensation protein A [Treponema sp.]
MEGNAVQDKVALENGETKPFGGEKHKFTAGKFEGPLDLLWSLIRENKINVYDIPIAEITEQFLDYLDYAVETNLQDLSEFYLWAAKLVEIKSRFLLPLEAKYDDDESMEDPRTELVEQLIEYQRFKKLSELMEEQEEQSEWSFERKKIERMLPFENDESQWQKVDTWALLQDMQKIFRNLTNVNHDERILNKSEDISPNEKITLMNELLDKNGECMFTDLITRHGNELDVICAFIAILEAVKFRMAEIWQNKMFGDIKICRKKQAA